MHAASLGTKADAPGHLIGGAASSVVLKLNDLFMGKDNLSDLFMGVSISAFVGIRKIRIFRKKPNACVFTVIAHRPEHPQNMLNTLRRTQNTNDRKLRGNACSDHRPAFRRVKISPQPIYGCGPRKTRLHPLFGSAGRW